MLSQYSFLGRRPGTAAPVPDTAVAIGDLDLTHIGYEYVDYQPDGDVASADGNEDTWATGSFSASDYEIRASKISGITPTGSPLATWIALTGGASWQVDATVLTRRCTLKIEIRRKSDGLLLDSARVSMTATVEGGGGL